MYQPEAKCMLLVSFTLFRFNNAQIVIHYMPLPVTNYSKGHQNTDVSGTLQEGVCYNKSEV